MIRNVAALAYDGVAPFELGVLCEVFGLDRRDEGVPGFDFAVCGPKQRDVPASIGFSINIPHGLDRLVEADLVGIPAAPTVRDVPDEVLEAIRAAHARGAKILTVCSGAFIAGAAGLLDDRDCTTHWRYVDELARRFPTARVNADVLYVDSGDLITSAGTAAGIDACLHIVRQEYGAAIASTIARRMVVPPHRAGGQAQYIARQVPECRADTLGDLLAWIPENLTDDLGVERLAREAHMSARTFARRFKDETGTTPHQWVTTQRVEAAEHLLETSDLGIDQIAHRVGFGNGATLRHHFGRVRGVSPQIYRSQFAS